MAAPGLALGPLFVLQGARNAAIASGGSPAAEAERLRAAMAAAIDDLEKLQREAEAEAAAILEFQIEMLGDEALAETAFAAIAAGRSAASAWREALDAQIADYEAAADEYFRARASDLADIRDRVAEHVLGTAALRPPTGAILVARDLPPSRFLACDWSAGGGIALTGGSPSSHVAMLARARGVPMITGLGLDLAAIPALRPALLDGTAGRIKLDPAPPDVDAFRVRIEAAAAQSRQWTRHIALPAVTATGERIATDINIASPQELDGLDPAICDGIGLVRTEFLFDGQSPLPDEERQLAVYRRILAWAQGRPVTIRTLDAGGDKPIPGLTIEAESNPFLGLRGIRLSLAYPDIFRIQLRALARAAAHGALKIMLPMVTVPEEIAKVAVLLKEIVADLEQAGIECRLPELGIMVEVPVVALAIESYDAAFFSIGSNDLTQYATAAARDIASVAALNDTANPGVLALIERVARFGLETGRSVSLCGDAAGDPRLLPLLLERGLRRLSVAPALLGPIKAAIAQWQPR